MRAATLARMRIVQFVVIGGAIFAASSMARRRHSEIALTRAELTAMHDAEAARKGATPIASMDERAIEDEILYREGLKQGFDRNDAIIRQRVIQKTLFLAEEMAGASEPPTPVALRTFYEDTCEQWTRPERWKLAHALVRDERRVEELRAAVVSHGGDPRGLGEPSPLPQDTWLTRAQIETTFGKPFADAIVTPPPSDAAIPSAVGFHFVRVLAHEAARVETFDEAAPRLRGAYALKRREDAVAALLTRAFRDYSVTIDGAKVAAIWPRERVAVRRTGSAED